MANFLITGARAPVALELARNLSRYGHHVFSADSLQYPLCRNTRCIKAYFRIAEPRTDLIQFKQDIQKISKENAIDYILPTCEEVFYIAYLKPWLSQYAEVLCADFELLKNLHSKYVLLDMAKDVGVSIPATEIVSSYELAGLSDSLHNKVIKKEYCRFGVDVLTEPNQKALKKLARQTFSRQIKGRYLLQEKIIGREYCTYAIAKDGRLMAQVCYEPNYLVKKAAGIYFSSVKNERVFAFVRGFVEKYKITGQIGFDFILDGEKLYLIECNPRATSGLHLLEGNDLYRCFMGLESDPIQPEPKRAMIGLAMFLISLPLAIAGRSFRQWLSDFKMAREVIYDPNDKGFFTFQICSLCEILQKAVRRRVSVRAASTMDIEWDGELMEEL